MRRAIRGRGFTMLELTLATMVGAMVLAAALGVFASMERGDAVLARRAKENIGLEMAGQAIERAMSTLVMDSAGQTGGTKTGAARSAEGTDGGDGKKLSEPAGRPRFLLQTDLTAGLPGMPDVAPAREGTAGSAALVAGSLSSPQRLEVVVARHPMPLAARPAAVIPVSVSEEAEAESNEEGNGPAAPAESRPVAVRGSFDLRPEPVRPGAPDEGTTWGLWWRPIERRVDDGGAEAFAGDDARAVLLATGLKAARWSIFYEETWETSHATSAVLDLPAYVKLQLTTATGIEADWLFEVGWSMGPEFKKTETAEEEDGATGDDLNGDEGKELLEEAVTVPDASAGPGRARTATPSGPPKRVKPGAVKPPVKKPKPPGSPSQPPKAPGTPAGSPSGASR